MFKNNYITWFAALYETHSIIVDWDYSPKFHFSYGETSYCFLHDEIFKKNNPCKWFRYEPFCSRYLWHHHNRTNQFWKTRLQIIRRLLHLSTQIRLFERAIRSGVINSIENLKNYKHHEEANFEMKQKETIDFSENINFHGLQDMFGKSLTNQTKYFRNFMKVFELLLLFTRAN